MEILHQDLETMEKRLKIKNDVILDLEEKVKKQNAEMLQLQDEILSWKMHASRKDDTLLPTSNSERHVINMISAESLSQDGREEKKKTNDHEHISKQTAKVIENVIDMEKNTDKKKVLLLGTSNTRFINTSYLSSSKVEVEKVLKYRLNEAQEYIDAFKAEDKNADAFVLHLLDDITEETPELCSEKLHQLCAVIKQKAKGSKIIVSVGLPRRDEKTKRKISTLNVLLQEKLDVKENVHLCNNSNLFYRGYPSRGIFNADGKHLSRQGTQKMGADLKSAIYKALGEPNGTGVNRSNGFYGSRYSGPWRGRPRYGYRGGYN